MLRAWTPKKYLRKAAKIIGWILLSVISLLLLLIALVQVPAIQNTIVQKIVTQLEQTLKTNVSLGHIAISFPKKLVLEELYVEDQSGDTLLYAGELSVDTDLFALLKKRIQINNLALKNWDVRISREYKEEAFNYDFIPAAFAADSVVEVDTTKSPWGFDVGSVEIRDVNVSYHDLALGNEIDAAVGALNIDVEELNFDAPRLLISSLDFEDSKIDASLSGISDNVGDTLAANADTKPFAIDLKEAKIENVTSTLKTVALEQILHIVIGKLDVETNAIDLPNNKIDIDLISLSNSFISFQHTGTPIDSLKATNNNQQDTTRQTDWNISLRSLDLKDNSLQYYDFNKQNKASGIDFSNLWLRDVNISANNLSYNSKGATGKIVGVSLNDRSGFSISSFTTEFELTDDKLTVDDFAIETPNSRISMEARSHFFSLASLAKTYPNAGFDLDCQANIGLRDILYFNPELSAKIPLKGKSIKSVSLNIRLSGKVKNFLVEQFNIKAFSDTRVSARGRIQGLPDKQAVFHVSLDEFFTTRRDLKNFMDDSLFTKFGIPEKISIKGKYDGTATTPTVAATLTSDIGKINIDATMDFTLKGKESYAGKVSIQEFQLGTLLKRDDLGRVDMDVAAKGTGLSMKDLSSRIDASVNRFQYRDYDYHGFQLTGSFKNYFFSGKASLNDKNLSFAFSGDLDYSEDIALYKFDFDLKHADFNALNLSERLLKARGRIDVDLATADFRSINGTLDIRDVAIFNGEALYSVDSLLFASIDQTGNSKISIRSDIMTGDFEGTINLFDMGNALRRHFNNYYSLRDSTFDKPVEKQKFSFALILKNTDLLTEVLLPELEPFVPGKIAGEFDSENDKLDLNLDLTKIRYGNVAFDSILLKVASDENAMDYVFRLRKVTMDTISIEALSLSGTVSNDSIRTKFIVLDSMQKEKYVLGGAFYSGESTTQFRLLNDEVIINNAPWETPPDNYLSFGKRGVEAHNFSITNINESISFIREPERNSTSVVVKDLNIQNLLNIVEGTILADGLMNGNITLADGGSFQSDILIEDLDVFNSNWGNLNLKTSGTSNGVLTGALKIAGRNIDVNAEGEYRKSADELKMTTRITSLDLGLIEPFTAGQMKQMKGSIRGEMRVTGNTTSPDVRGSIYFDEASFIPVFVGTPFTLKNESIAFTEEGILLRDFNISDQNNSAASLNGTIGTKNYSTFTLNLRLAARNFQLLNTNEDDNDLFYGNLSINTDATVTGTLTQPKIRMQMSLMEESNLTYIVPQSEKGVMEQRGIVLFVDRDSKEDPFLASINPRDTAKSTFVGIDLTANIELNDKETLSIIIDPATGDRLTVKGNSTLTLDIDPTGDMTLSGRYEITEGTYDLSFYKIVKRNFSIRKGSTITWSGDPLLATMDISAAYEVETSPLDLIINQVPITDQQQTNMYKQRLPFLVYLNIHGDLLSPDITFELDMPVDSRDALGGSVYAKIKDVNTRESDLNKQVFALLILRRFVSDNPFETEAGSSVAATARRSVSKLLTEQLNRMSENIKGIELSFDVKSYEDYTSGEAQGQTAVQLGVSKSLLDDRLIVKVSGNVDIEGNATNQNSFTDYIGDLALEYKLTEDGRFRITGFRNNNYDIISGELIETGAGLIYIKDYNALRELFKANAKTK